MLTRLVQSQQGLDAAVERVPVYVADQAGIVRHEPLNGVAVAGLHRRLAASGKQHARPVGVHLRRRLAAALLVEGLTHRRVFALVDRHRLGAIGEVAHVAQEQIGGLLTAECLERVPADTMTTTSAWLAWHCNSTSAAAQRRMVRGRTMAPLRR